jgi:hypothetical protein
MANPPGERVALASGDASVVPRFAFSVCHIHELPARSVYMRRRRFRIFEEFNQNSRPGHRDLLMGGVLRRIFMRLK